MLALLECSLEGKIAKMQEERDIAPEEDRLEFQAEPRVDETSSKPDAKSQPWIVLVVDDDPSVHEITRVVLEKVTFRERGLVLLSAMSAKEAWKILQSRDDVAVILLDVVMETEDAGLRLVRRIREELRNEETRIILRTGQPGQAPERDVIIGYDINDYKSKTELSSQKLFTATISALRAYSDLQQILAYQSGLARVLDASDAVLRAHDVQTLARVSLEQMETLLDQDGEAAMFLVQDHSETPPTLRALAAKGAWQDEETLVKLLDRGIFSERFADLSDDPINDTSQAIHRSEGDQYSLLRAPDGTRLLIVQHGVPGPKACDEDFVLLFLERLGPLYHNLHMRQELLDHREKLEETVATRTAQLSRANAKLLKSQERIEEELSVAAALQQAIVSAVFPESPHYEGVASMKAARRVSGDFYDIFDLRNGHLGFVIADTCGKGVPAAIFMSMARSILRGVAFRGGDPAEVLHKTNHYLARQNPTLLFVSAFYGILEPHTGRVIYANAGADLPLLRRRDGSVTRLDKVKGVLLGITDDFDYATGQVDLSSGDELYLYTDGISEARSPDGNLLGDDGFLDMVEHRPDGALDIILPWVFHEVCHFASDAGQSDDITCMILRYL